MSRARAVFGVPDIGTHITHGDDTSLKASSWELWLTNLRIWVMAAPPTKAH